ncbi:CRISPR-associated ring nuclease Csm6 [Vibrio breoganii]|uniref:CRISPR-associated ring nuclease Csm6 n=1 Tax=Vibrio breoganii TaxID=553239 RepID=UPI000C846A1A|nr:CRISPR-associated ring nuclease Csm6 [Vibrio breoganii]PMK26302.1 CRISPR-associated protein [Vibrio breoganii]
MKNVLVAVTGASPQVLTETIYALHKQGKPLPEEVFVITTKTSEQTLVTGLFEEGHWQKLLDEYELGDIAFSQSNIWCIADDDGQLVDDAKSEEDQSIMADYITRKVAELTSREDIAIHASIAGGRKTMAFYMGYAMSLYGREQDVLSHVFVNDEFEFVRDFYFPTKNDNWIPGKNGIGKLNTKLAQVTLAEIPFVRMRKQFESKLLDQIEEQTFSKTVAMMNNAATKKVEVNINTKNRSLSVLGIDIKVSAKLLALYLFILNQPNRSIKTGSKFVKELEHSKQYLEYFHSMKGDARVYSTFGLEDVIDWQESNLVNLNPMQPKFIQEVLSQFHSKLGKSLPPEVLEKLKVHSDGVKGGATYHIDSSIEFTCDGERVN